jgi:hypothetical protein
MTAGGRCVASKNREYWGTSVALHMYSVCQRKAEQRDQALLQPMQFGRHDMRILSNKRKSEFGSIGDSRIGSTPFIGPRGRYTYVQTGDINLMWTRDSAVQIAIYMPRMTRFPAIRLVVEGVIR